jgi:hypothetical protein
LTGGVYEAGHWTYAVLFWDWNDASFVYSGNHLNPDFYYWLPGVRISSVLLLKGKIKIRQNAWESKCILPDFVS